MNGVQMQALIDELTNDPLTRGYSGMTNQQVADSLNSNTGGNERSQDKTSLSGDEIFQATDSTQFAGLTDAQKSQWLAFCGRDSIDPFASANVTFVQNLFSGGATVTNLNALRVEDISRAQELSLGTVKEGDVEDARFKGAP